MKKLIVAALTAALFGCASSGPKIDAGQLTELRKGQTTATAVYKQFGRPSFLSRNMDGSQTAIYVHADNANGNTVVPVMGAIVGKSEAATETVTFYFDPNGILTDYKMTQPAQANTASEASPPTSAQSPAAPAAKAAQPTAAGAPPAPGAKTAADVPQTTAGVKAAPGTPQATAAAPPPAAAKAATGNSMFLNLPSFLPSESRDPRNPQPR